MLLYLNTKSAQKQAMNNHPSIKQAPQKPNSPSAQRQKEWFHFLDLTHSALKALGLQRVETPTLTKCIGTEPDLNFFKTQFNSPIGRKKNQTFFLSPSPEMNMKRLICQGWNDIYEIKKCFRNSETGPLNPIEFYMLEWYRTNANLKSIKKDLYFLLNFISQKHFGKSFPPLKEVRMKDLFWQYLKIKLKPSSPKKDFITHLKKHSLPFSETNDISDLFHLLFLNKIEPLIDPNTPIMISDYPSFQKAYARLNSKGWAIRFEFFWKGMELANAFDEVTSQQEQKVRFQEEKLKRKEKGHTPIPPPLALLKDMEKGMPPSAGIALGLDRLFMAFTHLKNIQQIRLFKNS